MRIPASLLAAALAAVPLLAVAPVSALGAADTSNVAGCKGESGAQSAATASYRFVLRVGMHEKMYTPAQVKKTHPKTGEVMLSGTMSAMGQMAMGTSMRHLEVQICSRSDRAVIANAHPTIFLVDSASKTGAAIKVAVAVMEGIGKGLADLHYGNNVQMAAGRSYTVKVSLKGETITFHVHLAMHP